MKIIAGSIKIVCLMYLYNGKLLLKLEHLTAREGTPEYSVNTTVDSQRVIQNKMKKEVLDYYLW